MCLRDKWNVSLEKWNIKIFWINMDKQEFKTEFRKHGDKPLDSSKAVDVLLGDTYGG